MKFNSPACLLLTSLVSAMPIISTSPALAQDELAQDESAAQPSKRPAHESSSRVTVNFPGGSIDEYVKALGKSGTFNIVVRSDAGAIPVPPVQLTNAAFSSAIELLDGMESEDESNRYHVTVRGPNGESGSTPVYVVDAQSGNPKAGLRSKTRVDSTVQNIADLVESGLAPENILQAIETAVAMFGDQGKAPDIRFHEPTGLILARGNIEQMDAIKMVVSSLRDSPAMVRRSNESKRKAELAAAEQRQARMATELEKVRTESDAAVRERMEAAVRLDSTAMELDRLRQQLEIEQSHLRNVQAQADTERMRAEQLEQELQAAQAKKEKEGATRGGGSGGTKKD